jgi:hypothetical protein
VVADVCEQRRRRWFLVACLPQACIGAASAEAIAAGPLSTYPPSDVRLTAWQGTASGNMRPDLSSCMDTHINQSAAARESASCVAVQLQAREICIGIHKVLVLRTSCCPCRSDDVLNSSRSHALQASSRVWRTRNECRPTTARKCRPTTAIYHLRARRVSI